MWVGWRTFVVGLNVYLGAFGASTDLTITIIMEY